mgnify:FL=1
MTGLKVTEVNIHVGGVTFAPAPAAEETATAAKEPAEPAEE